MNYHQNYSNSIQDPINFWRDQARQIEWFKFPETILAKDTNDLYRWFEGGQLNTCYLALDHHVKTGRGNQTALIYDSPVTNTKKKYTYSKLLEETSLFAGVLKKLGVVKGDRVVIYMPLIPEVIIGMLACARLGAVHSVVFGGFASHELAIRIYDASPKVILAASGGIEVNKVIPYKPNLDNALEEASHNVQSCVIYQREFVKAAMTPGRDYDWVELSAEAEPVDCVSMDATDPLYILYTSGTTGVPKGIVRDHGGHAVAMKYSMKYVYGAEPGETFWAASDVGWVVGHSYIVYGPLIHGCTTILYEGKPIRTPDAAAFWRVINEHNVNVFFTAPTAFRAIIREDPYGSLKADYPTPSLKYLFLAGERTDLATLEWCEKMLGIPVIDHWWQTESGWPMLSLMTGYGMKKNKAGSAGPAVCGYEILILDEDANEVPPNIEGIVLIKYPMPPGCLPNLWQDTKRFKESYLDEFPGYFYSGDGGYKDEDGFVFITGRIDDIINVAGHRLSTAKMEEVIAYHDAIAECAVIGVEDSFKGQLPIGFFVLKTDVKLLESEIEQEVIKMIRGKIGPVASFKRAVQISRLPKTRSGKVLRKIMRAIADDRPFDPPSTIEDLSVLDEIREVMIDKGVGNVGKVSNL